jgi:hypothetical protein
MYDSKVIHIHIVDKSRFNLFLTFGFYLVNSKNTKIKYGFVRFLKIISYNSTCASSWLAYSSSGSGSIFNKDSCNEIREDAEYSPM